MLKYIETAVVFSEIPDEISLDINITGCPYRCPGCHSAYLQQDIGVELTTEELDGLIEKNAGISCVLFSGGDKEPEEIKKLAQYVHLKYPYLKTAMYSGAAKAWKVLWESRILDYYKIGPWIKEKGPLDSPTTNQRLYKLTPEGYIDITYRFIEKKQKNL